MNKNIKNLGTVLFFGRKNCSYSKKVKKFLQKKSKILYFCESKKKGEKIKKKYLRLKYNYIFCFRSFYILKENLLKKVSQEAINFHPGPPEYRGTGCVNYALYDNSKFYGCTAHLVNKKIDSGKIISVKKFKINQKEGVDKVLLKTYKVMTQQAISIINQINKNPKNIKIWINKNKNIKWSKKIRKLNYLNKFYEIKKHISKRDLINKIRATNTIKFKPYLYIHGKKFILE
tara:strand:- start:6590 stop:7282 length:693 start_codon:yes stop_codon:yes gene_type:complete